MKATSVLNFLTAVLILMTGQVGNAQNTTGNREVCERKCPISFGTEEDGSKTCEAKANQSTEKITDTSARESKKADLILSCKSEYIASCKANCATFPSQSSQDEKCTTAVEKLDTENSKEKGACDEYQKAKGTVNSCKKRIEDCERKINEVSSLLTDQSTAAAGQLDPSGGAVSVLSRFYAQKNGIDPKTLGMAANTTASVSCLTWSNEATDQKKKDNKNEIDKIDDKIKAAKKSLADLEKDIAKENESFRKEAATIDEDKEKIQTIFKENELKIDSEQREKYSALSKAMQDGAIKTRNLTNDVIKLKESLEKEKFEHSQRMIDFADDKIEGQCKGAVETARGCFMRAAKGEKFPQKDTCEGFSPTGKGISGTSVMAQKLNDVRKACFERANLAQDKARFDYQTRIKSLEYVIIEKQKQVQDENDTRTRQKNDYDSILKESEKKKGIETQSSDQKLANLVEKLNKVKASTDEKIAGSNKQIEVIKLEIEELTAKKMPGALGIIPDSKGNDIQVAHREAKAAIKKAEAARVTAYKDCACATKLKTDPTDETCTRLKTSYSDPDGGGIGGKKRRSGR